MNALEELMVKWQISVSVHDGLWGAELPKLPRIAGRYLYRSVYGYSCPSDAVAALIAFVPPEMLELRA